MDSECTSLGALYSIVSGINYTVPQTLKTDQCVQSLPCASDPESPACKDVIDNNRVATINARVVGFNEETGAAQFEGVDFGTGVDGDSEAIHFSGEETGCSRTGRFSGCYYAVVLASTFQSSPELLFKGGGKQPAQEIQLDSAPWRDTLEIVYHEDAACSKPLGVISVTSGVPRSFPVTLSENCAENFACLTDLNHKRCTSQLAGTGEWTIDVLAAGVGESETGTGNASHSSTLYAYGGCRPASAFSGCYFSLERLDNIAIDPARLVRPSPSPDDLSSSLKFFPSIVHDTASTHVAIALKRAEVAVVAKDARRLHELERRLCSRRHSLPNKCTSAECSEEVKVLLNNGCTLLKGMRDSLLESTTSSD